MQVTVYLWSYYFYSIACDPGYYSLGNQKECTLCPEGEFCATNIQKGIPCENDGQYSDAESTNCTTCEAGFYCPNTKGEDNKHFTALIL